MTKAITKLFLLFLVLSIIVSCQTAGVTTSDEDVEVRVIVKKVNHDFWKVVEMGALAAEKEFGIRMEYIGPTSEEDIEGQIRMVQAAIDDKVDAIVLAAVDYDKLVPVAEKARSEGIPVVIIDSNINSDKMNSFIGTDNVEAGRILGQAMVENLDSYDKVAVVSFVKGAASSNERERGVKEIIDENPTINLIDTLYCNSDESIAKRLTIDTLRSHPDIDAFVCLNAYATVGTARGIIEMGMQGKVKIIGFDSTPEEISYLEKDIIDLLVVQNPFSMGYLGVKYAIDAINGKKIPKTVNTGAIVINKENMYLPENQKLVFPFVD